MLDVTGTDARIKDVPRSKQAARDWYDSLSGWYGTVVEPFEAEYTAAGLRMLDVGEGERVLELAFGPGRALVSLARAVGDAGHVSGLDVSRGMCTEADSLVRGSGFDARVDLVCGDATTLPFDDGAFDAVFTSFALELFDTPDIPVLLAEVGRVLDDGGRVGVVSLSRRNAGTMTHLYEAVHDLVPTYVDCRPIYVADALVEAGFTVRDATLVTMWGLPVEIVVADGPRGSRIDADERETRE